MTVVPVGRRPHRVPAPGRRRRRSPGGSWSPRRSDVPMKGLVPLLEAVAKLRTERDIELVVIGNPRRRRPGGQGHRATRPGPHRALRHRHHRRGAGPHLRRGRGGGGALAVRGVLAARPSRPWPAACRWWPPPEGRCPRWWGPTGRPDCWWRPTIPGALAGGHRPPARRRRPAPAGSARPGASGCSGGSPGRSPRPAPPPSTGPCWTASRSRRASAPTPRRRRPPEAA